MLSHKSTEPLETKRLLLRRYTAADAQAMFDNWASDPEVTKYLMWQPHSDVNVSREVIDGWVERYGGADYYHWTIVPKDTGEPAGDIAVVEQNETLAMAHIGYALGRRFWRRGYMSEALAAVIDFLFAEVRFNRIESRHDPNNPHSGGVMKKCGMAYEGTLRQADYNNQGIVDARVYAILREDWIKRRLGKRICCCGQDCSRCFTYLATVCADDELREKSRRFYRDAFNLDIPAEKIHCLGADSSDIFYLCGGCPWIKCAAGKGLAACDECGDYPCRSLAEYQAKYVNKCNQAGKAP